MSSELDFSRRRLLRASVGTALATFATGFPGSVLAIEGPLAARPIPQSGEPLPVVGIGTAIVFDFENDPAKFAERRAVIQTLVSGGGKLIDTAYGYGRAEDRVGEIVDDLAVRDRLFLATKFSYNVDRAAATVSMQASLRRLRTNRVDLMQAWNVGDINYDFGLLREWKRQGLCRYVGMTTSSSRQYEAIGKVLVRERPDFLQLNYSLADREADEALLPAAGDAGSAVLINLPFGRNSLFRKVGTRPLPEFAAEFGAKTWAQFFLKFILSHPSVTAVIPGTDKPEYVLDNLQAGRGPLPDAAMRKRIVQYWDSLT